ncbi:oligosaccharide flippase family protein [Vibrio vulnificus]|uniref:oligosaccharide flippase family protein n=1 Tax=Vibrio vulnificus TaxID=672 RepID=UPI0005F1643F|nr:oligosaccharide flippase family protein [Vibrio vulnificus]EMB7843716.1 oligosaccharide flippase family protein [Vibrio vulnificus]
MILKYIGLIKNISSLSAIQIGNLLVPLLSFPYLVRVLGEEYFGQLSFCLSVIVFSQMIVDLGTGNYAAREISVFKSDINRKIDFFINIIKLRFVVCFFLYFLLFGLTYSIQKFSNVKELLLLTYIACFGYAINCDWYFVGIQKNFSYLKILLIGKLLNLLLIFIFVKEISDINFIPIANGLSVILVSIFGIILALKDINLTNRKVIFSSLFNLYFLELGIKSSQLFVSKIAIEFYRGINPIILGLIADYKTVGYYVVAEKIITIIQTFQFPVGRALLPYMTEKSRDNGDGVVLKIGMSTLPYTVFIYVLLALTVYLFSSEFVMIVSGSNNENIVRNLKILSIVLIFGGVNYFISMGVLIPLKKDRELAKMLVTVGVLNVALVTCLIFILKDFGASISLVISELILSIFMLRKINYYRKQHEK